MGSWSTIYNISISKSLFLQCSCLISISSVSLSFFFILFLFVIFERFNQFQHGITAILGSLEFSLSFFSPCFYNVVFSVLVLLLFLFFCFFDPKQITFFAPSTVLFSYVQVSLVLYFEVLSQRMF